MTGDQGAVSRFETGGAVSPRNDDIATCAETRAFIRTNVPPADFQRTSENHDEAAENFPQRIAVGSFPEYEPNPVLDQRIVWGLLFQVRNPGVGGFRGRTENACRWAADPNTSIEAAALFHRMLMTMKLDEDELRAFGQVSQTEAYKTLQKRVIAYVPA